MIWARMPWQVHSLKDEKDYDLGTDAVVTVCSWNTNGIMVAPWTLW